MKIKRTLFYTRIIPLIFSLVVATFICLFVAKITAKPASIRESTTSEYLANSTKGTLANENLLNTANRLVKNDYPNAEVEEIISFSLENNTLSYYCLATDEVSKIVGISFEVCSNDVMTEFRNLSYENSLASQSFTLTYFKQIDMTPEYKKQITDRYSIQDNYKLETGESMDLSKATYSFISFKEGSNYTTISKIKYENSSFIETNAPLTEGHSSVSFLYWMLYNVCA